MPLGTGSLYGCAVRHPLALLVIWGTSILVEELDSTLMPNKRILFCVMYGILFGIRAVVTLWVRTCFDGKMGLNFNCEKCQQHSFCKLKRNSTQLICHATFSYIIQKLEFQFSDFSITRLPIYSPFIPFKNPIRLRAF